MENCNCHNETILKGSGQLERYLKALDPAYVAVDGRSVEDLLLFAAGYADQINFYDMPESPVNDGVKPGQVSWQEFFERDMAVIAASIASVDLEQIKNDYDDLGDQIQAGPTVELYARLFDQIAAIAEKIDNWYAIAIPQNPLYNDVTLAINSVLNIQLKKALSYEEGFIVVDSKTTLDIDYSKILNQHAWGLTTAVEPDFDIYQGTTPEEKMLNAVPYVDDVFHAFYSAISNIVEQSENYILFALKEYPAHQPYMALFIAFLKLFKVVQEQMNGLTGRMLDFYYEDVLKLAKKPAVADKVYVVFQLAQNVAQYDLAQGTSLSAGKDASGKDQVYQTENDFVINQAVVKELKNIYIDKVPGTVKETNKQINTIFANPVANSLDGYGAKFPVPNTKWPTFGGGGIKNDIPKNICEFIDKKQAELNAKNSAQIGFAVASPQLVLQGGNRLIKIEIGALEKANTLTFKNLQIMLTGEKGWLTVDTPINNKPWLEKVTSTGLFDTSLVSNTGYVFVGGVLYVYLPVSEQGIVAYNAKLHKDHTFNTPYPVAQVLIGPDVDLSAAEFNSLTITQLSLSVRVGSINIYDPNSTNETGVYIEPVAHFDGLTKLVIQNDYGTVAAGKAFDPFTNVPSPGSSFYIGSDEVFNKPLGQLAVNMSKTQGLTVLKGDYLSQPPVEYDVSVLYNNNWLPLVDYQGDEFSTDTLTYNILNQATLSSVAIKDKSFVNLNPPQPLSLDRRPIEYFSQYNLNADKGFLRLDNAYQADAVRDFYRDIQARLDLAPQLQIKAISLSYISELDALVPGIDQFFHVYPFGSVETTIQHLAQSNQNTIPVFGELTPLIKTGPLVVNGRNKLLPQFTYLSPTSQYEAQSHTRLPLIERALTASSIGKVPEFPGDDKTLDQLILEASDLNEQVNGGNNQYSARIQEEGLLFIGIDKLQPLQTLSLLFQFADGSAVDEDGDPPTINWSYLIYNEWRPLKAENIISDSTYGFQTTGIIKFDIPGDANDNHSIITDGLYWLCASVTANSNRVPQLINVVAQATEAQFADQGNSPLHYDNALPAGSITKLSVATSQITQVQQPFASFDGKHAEVGKEYYTRVSERLRHKGRAITTWDYEHLVLDRFPDVFKVKCIPNVDPNCLCRKPVTNKEAVGKAKCCGPVTATGNIMIVPVPNLKNDNAANPLQPKTSRLTLVEIVNYLSGITSPFVTVHARNPVYEQVITYFRVQFLDGVDKGYYLKKLNDEIVQYLTPWAFDATIEADFGQKIYASNIINFIQQRPYVDFITDFLMGVCRDECCPPKKHNATPLKAEDIINGLNEVSGCQDIENWLKDQNYFTGDTIAEPSSQMSLLVSAPKHIILLYEEPQELTPCQKKLLAPPTRIIVTNPDRPPVIAPEGPTDPVVTDPVVTRPVVDPAKPVANPVKPVVNINPDNPVVTDPVVTRPTVDPVSPVAKPVAETNTVNPVVKSDTVNTVQASEAQKMQLAEKITASEHAATDQPAEIKADNTTAALTIATDKAIVPVVDSKAETSPPAPGTAQPATDQQRSTTDQQQPDSGTTQPATYQPQSELVKITSAIEKTVENIEKGVADEASKLVAKGKETVKKAEDLFKKIIKGKPGPDSGEKGDMPEDQPEPGK